MKLGRVIVALNSDEDIRRKKGPGRPIEPLAVRRQKLYQAGAAAVHVIHNDAELLELTKAIRPDYRVVGSDYTEAQVVGAAEVKGWGGQVVIIKRLPNISTTEILEARKAAG